MKKFYASILFLVFIANIPFASAISTSTVSSSPLFSTNLSFGMTGSESVKTLQQFLTAQGLYSGPITGNFFTLTQQGVKEFQIVNKIVPSVGYFGPLTRATANAIALTENSNFAAAASSSVFVATSPSSSTDVPSPSLLAYMQLELGYMLQTVRNLGQRYFGWSSSGPTPTQPVTTTPVPTAPTPTGSSPAPAPVTTTPTPVSSSSSASITTPTPTTTPATTTTQTSTGKNRSGRNSGSQNQTPTSTTTPTPTSTPVTITPSPVTAPVIPSGNMLWGAYVGDIDGIPSLVSSFSSLVGGSPNIIATFADLSSGDFPSDEKTTVGAQGKTLLLFLEPQYSFDQLNSGAEDSVLQQYATAAASYGDPIILAPFDEFNLNENDWGYGVDGNTPAKFIQAWQHIHSFFANDPNVKFALVYNNVPEPATSANSYAAYYPGNAYVDYVAVDGFNFGTSMTSAQTFAQIFDPIMPTLEGFNKPILFTSIGSLEYPGKATWITQGLGTYIEQYPNIAGWVYFNYNDTSAGQNWRVDTDAASLAAFQAIVP